ncbi:MAG: L,D-transpeptidase [Rhizobiaceae bacterium]
MKILTNRRCFLLGGAALLTTGMVTPSIAATGLIDARKLKPGQWEWYPDRAPKGPVIVVVSLSDQLAYVYRNGLRIGVSTVSTGKRGYETPTGVFTVLRKERMHHSHAYHNAAMPDSQFFFGGAALHAGGLPGYPSSHGCVHLPRAFADRVFRVTHNGTPVIVTNEHSGMGSLSHAGLLLTASDLQQIEKMTGNIRSKTLPFDRKGYSKNASSVVVSRADRKVMVLENGKLVLEAPVQIIGSNPLGEHVFVLQGAGRSSNRLQWIAIGLGTPGKHNVNQNSELALGQRVKMSSQARDRIAQHLHPGSTYVITDLPAHPQTRTATDFVVMRVGSGR